MAADGCEPGLFLPLFEADWPRPARALIYFSALALIFPVAYNLAALLLNACAAAAGAWPGNAEDGAVPYWFGFSIALAVVTPNSLLAIIELLSSNFIVQDAIGPAGVLDQGAFALLGIGAACALAVPDVRQIASPRIALTQLGASGAAYLYLALILQVTSPDVIEVWEAIGCVCLLPAVALCLSRISSACAGPTLGVAYALRGEDDSPASSAATEQQPPVRHASADAASKRAALPSAPWPCLYSSTLCTLRSCCRRLVPASHADATWRRWLAISVCLAYAGALTALATDLASMLGCTLGIVSSGIRDSNPRAVAGIPTQGA